MRAPSRIKALKWIFALYCIVMIWLLFLQRLGSMAPMGRYNLVPLDTVRLYVRLLQHSESLAQRNSAIANLAGNVVLFIPFGIFIPLMVSWQQKFLPFVILTTGLLLLVELLQYVTGLGALDVDDMILNFCGVMIGRIFWRLLWKNKEQ